MGRFRRSYAIVIASWQVLMQHKKLLILPILSTICAIVLLIPFGFEIYHIFTLEIVRNTSQATQAPMIELIILLFFYYLFMYLIANYFNAVLVFCANQGLQQQPVKLKQGFVAMTHKIPALLGWSLIMATVGAILRLLSNSHESIEDFIAILIGAAWKIISFLALPAIVLEDKNPFSALKQSIVLLKQNWGERVIITTGVGFFFALLYLPGLVLIFYGTNELGQASAYPLIIIGIILFAAVSLFHITLQRIFETALYHYAREKNAVGPFADDLLQQVIQTK